MEKIHDISLYISTPSSGQVMFNAVQGDTGRKIRATIFNDDGLTFSPGSGTTAEYMSVKSDKNGTQHAASISGNVVTVQLTEQDLAAAGKVYASIVLKNGDTVLAAMPFWFMVLPIAMGNDVESTSEYQNMVDATEAAEEAAANANAAAVHFPYISSDNSHWMVWDTATQAYVDTGVPAAGADGMVLYSAAQTLQDQQKAQARNNIGAGSAADISDVLDAITDAYSASATYKVGELCIYNNTLYRCITAITTAEAWTAGHWTATTIADEIENRVLFFTGVSVSATTGTILSKSDSRITADHVVASCVWTNPAYITTDVTWTTDAGSLTMTGTCSTATTAAIILVKKNN